MKNLINLLILLLISTYAFANQQGIIRGTITDQETGETLIGAYVIIDGTAQGTTTDLDGNFTLQLDPGSYILKVTSIGYKNTLIEDVTVSPNGVVPLDIKLATEAFALDDVVITASISQKSDAALQTLQKRSSKLLDGISSQSFSKMGDGNAAAAVKRVSGVSIEGGKYVFVRGLGDRYTKTVLNGMSIPGLDPDKNTVQMDLFPTNLIDKIIVYKTFTPDLPGNFTGGLVDITTKDFPKEKTLNFSASLGLTSDMNLNSDFIGMEKHALDWLGFAGNSRTLHFHPNTMIPDESANDFNLYSLSGGFSRELGITEGASNFLNQGYAASFGNQYDINGYKLGLNLAANYSNAYKYYNDIEQAIFFKDAEDISVYKLDKRETSIGELGENEVLWSGLVGLAFKNKNNKISLTGIHSQSGTGKVANYMSQNFDETKATLYKEAIEYSQKSVTNFLLKGKHNFKEDKYDLVWNVSPTISKILEPDVRSTKLSYDNESDTYDLKLGDGAGINRFYRTLNEINYATKVDLTYNFKQWGGEDSKLKFGLSNVYKNRDYQILLYQFRNTNDFHDFSNNFNHILSDENLWTPENESGMYVIGNRDKNNEYDSKSNTMAAYIMNELPLTDRLKANYGVRMEHAAINYVGHYNGLAIDSLVHDQFVMLPSMNLVYQLLDNMNLRASYAQTVARPSFKEKSNAHIDDPISQTVFIGNLGLEETHIQNYDIRWEFFMKGNQKVSLSGFYKHFDHPIELVPFELSPNNLQPKNINASIVYGIEMEFRKLLTNLESPLKVEVGGNLTYLISKVNMKDVEVDKNGTTEHELRSDNARVGEEVPTYRTMQGQSPYIINTSINLLHNKSGIEANLSYNVQAKKLVIVGSGIVPDVYEDPFHSLSFKAGYGFGKDKKLKLTISLKNILNDNFEQYYSSFQATNETYKSYTKGRSYSLGFSYKMY